MVDTRGLRLCSATDPLRYIPGKLTILPIRPELRGARRFKVFEPAHYVEQELAYPIHLLDISVTGAKAYAETAPRKGNHVAIECGVVLGNASISWVTGNRFGVRFMTKLSQETLDLVARMKLNHV